MGIVLRKMPELQTEAQRQQFWSQVGGENLVISARTHFASQPPHPERLSVKAAFGGRVEYGLNNARLAVDDDTYLVVNAGTEVGCRIQSAVDVHSFTVHFADSTVAHVFGSLPQTPEDWLDHRAPQNTGVPIHFAEHLRPHDKLVTPTLRFLAKQVDRDAANDRGWWDEQLTFLLERLVRMHAEEQEHIVGLAQVRMRTKREIHRRIWAATDFLLSSYDRPLTLQQLADVACLAKYHFLRMFVAVHGLTPMEYLRCKRVAVASRLLQSTGLSLVEIARVVGVADRSTLLRLFVDYCGLTPEEYRRRLRAVTEENTSWTRLKDLLESRVANSRRAVQRAGRDDDAAANTVAQSDTGAASVASSGNVA
jgi:AraC family transcriptional regulator